MTVIIFDTSVTGHHLEYIHHLYLMASSDADNKYVFVIPESFITVKDRFVWNDVSNVSFDLFVDSGIQKFSHSVIGMIGFSKSVCKLAKHYVDKYKADALFTNLLMSFVPAAPFILPKKLKLSGIIYKIYLYNDATDSLITRFLNRMKYKLMSNSSLFHKAFVLNDSDSADRLNKIYKTDKFQYLPDPFVAMPEKEGVDFRKENEIPDEKIIFLHFGAMSVRKGTMEIVKSIEFLSEAQCNKYVFVFLGKVGDDIREEFYSKCHYFENKVQIIVKDEFCEYEYIASACKSCDAILAPYLLTDLSSGIIGYASQFGKPVIAPGSGLLGNLITKYKLGYCMEKSSVENLLKAYVTLELGIVQNPTNYYCEVNTITGFVSQIKGIF